MQINYRNADNSPVNVRFPDHFEDWVNYETCAATIYNRWKKIAHCSHCGHTWDYQETIYKGQRVYCPECGNWELALPHTTAPAGTHQYFFWLWLEGESIRFASVRSKWCYTEKDIDVIKDNLDVIIDSIGTINRDEQYLYGYIVDWSTGKYRWKKYKTQHVAVGERFVVDMNVDDLIARSFLKHMDIKLGRNTGTHLSDSCFVNYLIDEMVFCAKNPQAEYIKKAGLGELIECKLNKIPTFIRPNWKAKTIPQMLKLSPQDIDKLRQWDYFDADGILRYRYLKKKQNVKKEHMELCRSWVPDARALCCPNGYGWISDIRAVGNIIRTLRYLEKQYQKEKIKEKSINRNTIGALYKDYYVQLKELEYPGNDYYLYPKELKEAHDRIAKEYRDKQDEIEVKKRRKRQEKYEEAYLPKLEEYVYRDSNYVVRPLRDYKDFSTEGRNNKNCVASYYNRATEGITAVFVLRRIDEPDTSFVTIELRDNHIYQCYGTGNRLPAPEVRKWVDDWLKNIVKPRSKKKPKKGAA